MGWTLDQALFRRLVECYAAFVVLGGVASIYETFGPGWSEFSPEFEALAERHFGKLDDVGFAIFGGIGMAALVWHLVALTGLRKFRRWARSGFWSSMAVATLVLAIPGLAYPGVSGLSVSITTEISTALFGAILVLSYSREHGGLWFKTPLETLKEKF